MGRPDRKNEGTQNRRQQKQCKNWNQVTPLLVRHSRKLPRRANRNRPQTRKLQVLACYPRRRCRSFGRAGHKNLRKVRRQRLRRKNKRRRLEKFQNPGHPRNKSRCRRKGNRRSKRKPKSRFLGQPRRLCPNPAIIFFMHLWSARHDQTVK